MNLKFFLLLLLVFTSFLAKGQNANAYLRNNILVLQNEQLRLSYLWNEGVLKAVKLVKGSIFHSACCE